MKTAISKRCLALLLAVSLCFGLVLASGISVKAESATSTLSFADTSSRTSFSTEQQVWSNGTVTLTNDKSSSTSNVADYSNPARFYKNSSITVECTGMTEIVFTCNTEAYATSLATSIGDDATADGTGVTVSFASATDSYSVTLSDGQVRMDSITVTYDASSSSGDSGSSTPTTPEEIVKAAYALASGESLDGTYTLTGEVTKINYSWSSTYNNITVTIVVDDLTDYPIQCYRMVSGDADASTIEVGDTITVTGTLTNYSGTIEFTTGCTCDAIVHASSDTDETEATEASEATEATEGTETSTTEEILKAAYALAAGESLDGTYTLTGEVTAINTAWSSDYSNITVTIVVDGLTDYPIQCFRLVSGDADASTIVVGDTITVTGTLMCYAYTSGDTVVEFTSGCTCDAIVHASSDTDETDSTDSADETDETTEETEFVYDATKAYRIYAFQEGDELYIYYAGKSQVMTATANGTALAGTSATVTDDVLQVTSDMLKLIVHINDSGYYYFATEDGLYLTSATSGNGLSLTESLSSCSYWTLTASGTQLRNIGAKYSEAGDQYLEYYNGFTTYGMGSTTSYYTFEFYTPSRASDSTVQTGDTTPLVVVSGVLLLSMAGVVALVGTRKKFL